MLEIRQTQRFTTWLRQLKDDAARRRISARLVRLASGLFGDCKSVGEGVRELRVDFGPGYRIYFVQRERTMLLLLCGGDKSSQSRDIAAALVLAKEAWDDAKDDSLRR